MKKRNLTWIIIGIIVLFLIGFIYSNYSAKKDETITIGAALPLTGVSSFYGEQNKKGMELALENINSNGGINGKPLKIIYEDTTSKESSAVSSLQKLINIDKIKVVITSASSPETLAVAPVAEENKIVLLAAGSSAPKIRFSGDYIFRLKLSIDKEMQELMKFTYYNLSAKKIYILYVENDFGQGLKEYGEKEFLNLNGKILGKESFKIEEKDYRTYLEKIKKSDPDLILLGGWPRNIGLILKQAKELNLNKTFITSSGCIGPEIIEIAGNSSNGLIFNSEYDLESDSTKVFRQEFKNKYNEEPELFAAMGYDSVKILADILKNCSEKDPDCVKKGLYETKNYNGVSAKISFDEYGDISKQVTFETIKNGTFKKYEK